MRFRKPWLRVKSMNFDFSAKLLSTNYNESHKPNLKFLAHIGSEKSLVELEVPKNKLSRKSKSKFDIQYPRKDKYKNYQRKSGKSALATNESATVNTWSDFTMVLKGTYLFNPIFLQKYDIKWKHCRDQN